MTRESIQLTVLNPGIPNDFLITPDALTVS